MTLAPDNATRPRHAWDGSIILPRYGDEDAPHIEPYSIGGFDRDWLPTRTQFRFLGWLDDHDDLAATLEHVRECVQSSSDEGWRTIDISIHPDGKFWSVWIEQRHGR